MCSQAEVKCFENKTKKKPSSLAQRSKQLFKLGYNNFASGIYFLTICVESYIKLFKHDIIF